jgi:hypothetical protein
MQVKINKASVHVCEVGVGDLFCAKSGAFWDEGHRVTLVEPNPHLYASLLRETIKFPNVHLHHVAIANDNRLGWLVSAGILSYLVEEESPINTIFRGKLTPMMDAFKVPVNRVTMDRVDTGDIDMLILGMEGAEHHVFPHLISRPHAIILNNHFANDYRFSFPRFEVIQQWCVANGYQIVQGIPDFMLVHVSSYQNGFVTITP